MKKKQILADEQAKRADVDQAKATFDAKIAALDKHLQDTKADAANKISAAEKQVNDARAQGDKSIADAVNRVSDANLDMTARFGKFIHPARFS